MKRIYAIGWVSAGCGLSALVLVDRSVGGQRVKVIGIIGIPCKVTLSVTT